LYAYALTPTSRELRITGIEYRDTPIVLFVNLNISRSQVHRVPLSTVVKKCVFLQIFVNFYEKIRKKCPKSKKKTDFQHFFESMRITYIHSRVACCLRAYPNNPLYPQGKPDACVVGEKTFSTWRKPLLASIFGLPPWPRTFRSAS